MDFERSREQKTKGEGVKFSEEMIELAKSFKRGGVPWEPAAGHYVLDVDHVVERESPFQPGVYFILNLPHFLKLAGGIEPFRQRLVWLPTWEQARQLLRDSGLPDQSLQSLLLERDAIANGTELECLYRMISERYSST